jgi:hypothetical protein
VKIGIVGLPQSGKTTIFNAASGKAEIVGDYSKASHRAIIKVPDTRLDRLFELVRPGKATNAEIDYLDLCAFSGKGKQTDKSSIDIPQDLHYADALMVIIKCFNTEADPENNFNLFIEELILSDQIIVERNLEKQKRTAQLAANKEAQKQAEALQKCLNHLEEATPLSQVEFESNELALIDIYKFLSIKPILGVLNIAEDDIGNEDKWLNQLKKYETPGVREFVAICGKIEMELAQLDSDDRDEFLKDLGIENPAMAMLIQKSYGLMGLISFFTVSEPEVRAWTVTSGTNARKAAGQVHTDMEKGFIRAEVVKFEDFDKFGSMSAAKDAGKYRLEGKDYIVQDGDVIFFRFNV